MFKLNESLQQSRRCSLLSEANMVFEIQDNTFRFVVRLDERRCDCRRWDVTGIPYRHAWVAINHMRMQGENFISENHTKAAYNRAYDVMIQPISQHTFWPADLNNEPCAPPENRRLPGRPCEKRKKHPSEENKKKNPRSELRKKYKCRSCGQTGHNKVKCPLLKKKSNEVCFHVY